MILEVVVGWTLGFIVFAAIVLTLHEYVQFKLRDVLKPKVSNERHPTKGRYFELFVPAGQAEKYRRLLSEVKGGASSKVQKIGYGITFAFTLFFLAVCFEFYSDQKHKLYPPIDLGKDEIKKIPIDSHQFFVDSGLEALGEFSSDAQYVLIKSDIGRLDPRSRAIVQEEFENAQSWVESMGLKTKNCHWERIQNCNLSAGRHIPVVLTSRWDPKKLSQWLEGGFSILITGPQLDLFEGKGKVSRFEGIEFSEFRHLPERSFGGRVAGDRLLTLGIPAGSGMGIVRPQHQQAYRVQFKDSQVVGVDPNDVKSSYSESLLASGRKGRGRWVWADFLGRSQRPELERALFSNTVAFLEKQERQTVAHWPNGKRFAALVEQDTEDQFGNTEDVLEVFEDTDFPVTWFVLSELAETHRELMDRMVEVGEIACHGDNHSVFPEGSLFRQAYRLAKCRKTIFELVGTSIRGFRPPEEKYNTDTMSAVVNAEYDYFFSLYDFMDAVPRIAEVKGKGRQILLYPRMNHDDYSLWVAEAAPANKSLEILKEDVNLLSDLGALYTFSFHTQYMDQAARIDVVRGLVDYLISKEAYGVTGSELADWWVFRNHLLKGERPNAALLDKFKPQILKLNVDGELERFDYTR